MIIVMKNRVATPCHRASPTKLQSLRLKHKKKPHQQRNFTEKCQKLCFTAFFCRKSLQNQKYCVPLHSQSRDRAVVARQAHNLKVGGSTPSPATNNGSSEQILSFHFFCSLGWRQTAARRPSQTIGGTRPAPCTSAGNSPNAQPNCATYANSFFMHNL